MPIGDLLASITGEPSPTQATAPPFPTKRKTSDGDPLRRPGDKLQRTGSGTSSTANTSRPIGHSSRPSTVDTSMSRMKLGPNGRVSSAMSPSSSSTFKNGQPTPPPSDAPAVPAKPPKKGSYAEIMARGKVAQATMGQVGKIQHKRIEKLPTKKEREEMRAQKSAKLQKNIGPGGKFRNTPGAAAINGKAQVVEGRVGGKANGKPAEPVVEKKVKKAALATTGYSGTARPRPGAGKLPSKSSSHVSSSRYDRGPDRDRYRDDRYSSSKRYTYASEEDEEEEDDEEGYASEASSDMEAAAFEVDEEEELAARIARKEDAEALAEENRLKREKAEKKRRLEAMAKKRR
ncbi:hypothetical protein G7Y89_g5481 [Cudoniella acicularis]|uniref:SPT2 chromatin protein n=1 Tax=Cudoniella acicularis TaxID=354080 RepID=A0A8H4RPK1_9HELO|nr:hypothetical protein G7Y89_g5481 [Cudoniella acicularis]